MPDKKNTMKLERRRRREARQKVVNYITIGIVALAVVAFLGIVISSSLRANAVAGNCHVSTMQFSSPPQMVIDVKRQYFATFKMVKGGQFVIQLYPDQAPVTVNNFVFLADKGFFNCVTFHRVIDGFMAQTGDPTGTGNGGPGYQIPDETNGLKFDKAGVVAMANTGQPNSGSSQFFIIFAPQVYLNGGYTIFGQVISGMDVVNGLTRRDPDKNPTFSGDAIQSVTITLK